MHAAALCLTRLDAAELAAADSPLIGSSCDEQCVETKGMSRRRGSDTFDADVMLGKVHERTGLGIDIQTFSEGTVEVRWKRDFDGSWSEEQSASAVSICEALQAILDHED